MVNDDISPSLMVLLSKSQTIMKLIGFHLHLPPCETCCQADFFGWRRRHTAIAEMCLALFSQRWHGLKSETHIIQQATLWFVCNLCSWNHEIPVSMVARQTQVAQYFVGDTVVTLLWLQINFFLPTLAWFKIRHPYHPAICALRTMNVLSNVRSWLGLKSDTHTQCQWCLL